MSEVTERTMACFYDPTTEPGYKPKRKRKAPEFGRWWPRTIDTSTKVPPIERRRELGATMQRFMPEAFEPES